MFCLLVAKIVIKFKITKIFIFFNTIYGTHYNHLTLIMCNSADYLDKNIME